MPCRFPGLAHPGGKLSGLVEGIPGPHPRGKLRGLAWGVSRQAFTGGGLQAHTGGSLGPHPGGSRGPHLGVSRPTPREDVSQHALRQTPPRWLLLQVVRILLKCILVIKMYRLG